MQHAIDTVSRSTAWSSLAGPAAVVVASLPRVGWSCTSPTEWVIPTGGRLIVTDSAPRDVARLVSHSALQWSWSQASQRHVHMSHLDHPPFLSPIVRPLAEGGIEDFGARQKAALQALLAGALFHQGPCPL
eukprot:5452793-Pyramimonas_sp.AAC.1